MLSTLITRFPCMKRISIHCVFQLCMMYLALNDLWPMEVSSLLQLSISKQRRQELAAKRYFFQFISLKQKLWWWRVRHFDHMVQTVAVFTGLEIGKFRPKSPAKHHRHMVNFLSCGDNVWVEGFYFWLEHFHLKMYLLFCFYLKIAQNPAHSYSYVPPIHIFWTQCYNALFLLDAILNTFSSTAYCLLGVLVEVSRGSPWYTRRMMG